jgi:hypothetical protein
MKKNGLFVAFAHGIDDIPGPDRNYPAWLYPPTNEEMP